MSRPQAETEEGVEFLLVLVVEEGMWFEVGLEGRVELGRVEVMVLHEKVEALDG